MIYLYFSGNSKCPQKYFELHKQRPVYCLKGQQQYYITPQDMQ